MEMKSGQALQKWLAIQAEKLHNAAYVEVAAKLDCNPDKEAIHAAIRALYDSDKRATEMIHAVDENEIRVQKAKRRNGGTMKKSKRRRMEAVEQQRQANFEHAEMEYKIQQCEEELATANAGYNSCEKQLEQCQYDAQQLKERAQDLREQLKQVYKYCDTVEEKARSAAKDMEVYETQVLELSEQLVELKNEHDKMTALHFTIDQNCVSKTCKRVDWDTEVHKQAVKSIIIKIMTDISEFPEDFQELIGIANRQEIRQIAEVLAYNSQLKVQYPGKMLIWHFTEKNNVSELLEFAGLNLA